MACSRELLSRPPSAAMDCHLSASSMRSFAWVRADDTMSDVLAMAFSSAANSRVTAVRVAWLDVRSGACPRSAAIDDSSLRSTKVDGVTFWFIAMWWWRCGGWVGWCGSEGSDVGAVGFVVYWSVGYTCCGVVECMGMGDYDFVFGK